MMPERMRIVSGGRELLIEDACKDCTPGPGVTRNTDLMVVQCNASNVHGYVFTDAYVNILSAYYISDGRLWVIYIYPSANRPFARSSSRKPVPAAKWRRLSICRFLSWFPSPQ